MGNYFLLQRTMTCSLLASLTLLSATDGQAQNVRFDLPAIIKVQQSSEPLASIQPLVPKSAAISTQTPPTQFASADNKLITCHFDLSVHLDTDAASSAHELIFEIVPGNTFHQVVDFAPKTRQSSKVEGLVSIEKHDESNSSAGVDLNGSYEKLVHGSTHLTHGDRNTNTVRYQEKPDQTTVIASGTVRRGTGAIFKLRNSNDSTLEGQHRICVTWEVPNNWRGDLVQVTCIALGKVDRIVGKADSKVLARQLIVVPIAIDEPSALQTSKDFVTSDRQFRREVATWSPGGLDDWLDQNYREVRTSAKELFSGNTSPPWQQLIFRLDYRIDKHFVQKQLPRSLAEPAEQWLAERNHVLELSR